MRQLTGIIKNGFKDMGKDKDQHLFSQISIDIRKHKNTYRRAGEWLDGYCKNIKSRQLCQARCFGKARQYLAKKYKEQSFIPEDDARRIILITWLLTDADAEKRNLNITHFEKWAWEPVDDITSNSRCAASSLWSQNADAYDSWMRLVHYAWKSVESKQLSLEKPAGTGQKDEGGKIMITSKTSKENWEAIRSEYDISKKDFGKKIKFVSDQFKRKIIFRDVEHAFVLASQGFSKPALILAGGVIEELLRLYLEHKKIKPKSKRFVDYIDACENNGLLKRGVSRLSDSIRDFRNLVHLENEETKRHTISTAAAKGTVSSIFTIANDFR